MCLCLSGNAIAQDEWQRRWGIEANLSGGSFNKNKTLVNEDNYNAYSITADYYVLPHLTLTGGLYLEQDGMVTHYADGIGMKSIWMFGPEVGGKYYFLPRKWVVQPYLGVMLMTNVLNLASQKGSFAYEGDDIDCSKAFVNYDVVCPFATLSPRIGIDLRLTKNLVFTANMDYRVGFYGHNRSHIQVLEGYHAGNTYDIDESMVRNGFSIGLKVDLPWNKKSNSQIAKGLLNILYMWISSKEY